MLIDISHHYITFTNFYVKRIQMSLNYFLCDCIMQNFIKILQYFYYMANEKNTNINPKKKKKKMEEHQASPPPQSQPSGRGSSLRLRFLWYFCLYI